MSETKKLSIEDPIDSATLGKFQQLMLNRQQAADRLLDLENEKIRTLRIAATIEQERQKLFESVLVSRGLPPNFPVEVDAATGKIMPIPDAVAAQMQAQPANGVTQG